MPDIPTLAELVAACWSAADEAENNSDGLALFGALKARHALVALLGNIPADAEMFDVGRLAQALDGVLDSVGTSADELAAAILAAAKAAAK